MKRNKNKNTLEFTILSLICLFAFSIGVSAQKKSNPAIKIGKTVIKGNLQPKTEDDSKFHYINAKKGQTLAVEANSKSVILNEVNECGIVFMIYDAKGKALTNGDYLEGGIDSWKGKITRTGKHQIKVLMGCVEATLEDDLQKYKPKFRYSLEILLK